ncbi:hypothetical protein [Catellatospora methionotrophica]|uniref:hypothetical protein n=1 Tax=Catellatospora methionotrophica TaxID=121620 RepID=UPI0033C98283
MSGWQRQAVRRWSYRSAEQARDALFATPFGLDGTHHQIEVAVGAALDEVGLGYDMAGWEQRSVTRLSKLAIAVGEPELRQPFIGWIRRERRER